MKQTVVLYNGHDTHFGMELHNSIPQMYNLIESSNDSYININTTEKIQPANHNATSPSLGAILEQQPWAVDRTVISVFGNVSAVISLIGIICNTLNVIVLTRIIRRLPTSPIYHLLLAIGVSDLLALLFLATYYVTMFCRWPPILYQVSLL